MGNVSSSNTTTLYSTTQTTPVVQGAAVPTGNVNNNNFTTLYSQSNAAIGGAATGDLLVSGNLRVLGTSDLEGQVTIGNSYSLPTADGTANQFLATNGLGQLFFTSSTGVGKTYDISATTTTGGANFNLNSDVPTTDTIKFENGTNITVTATNANTIQISSSPADRLTNGIYDFVLESTGIVTLPGAGLLGDTYSQGIANAMIQPGSGGYAGANSFDTDQYVVTDNNSVFIGTNWTVTAREWEFKRDGTTKFPNYTFPFADGTANQVLATDGAGIISFTNNTGIGKTYDISASTTTGGADFNLNSDLPSTDTIKFAEGTNITITATSANEITISASSSVATDRLTNSGYDFILNADGTFTLPLPDTFSVGANPLIMESLGGDAITLSVDGTAGGVVLLGDGAGPAVIGANGANDLLWLADPTSILGQASFLMEASTGDIVFGPGPTGIVKNTSNTTVFGTGSATATLTTQGAYNMVLSTNTGTSSPTITLTQTGGIILNPNANSSVLINETGTGPSTIRRTASTGLISGTGVFQRNYTAGALSTMNGHGAANAFNVRDQAGVNVSYTRVGGTYSTTGDHDIFFEKSNDSFTTVTRMATLKGDLLTLGPLTGTPAQTITTAGAQDLILNTASNTNSPQISLIQGAGITIAGDITTTGHVGFQNGGGFITVVQGSTLSTANANYTLPAALPPFSNYVLASTTSGVMSWIPSAGASSVSATPNTVVLRDGNANSFANNTFNNTTLYTIDNSNPGLFLTAASSSAYVVTGNRSTTTARFRLPDATTLPVGAIYTFYNNNVTIGVNYSFQVQNAVGSVQNTLNAGERVVFTLTVNSTSSGTWTQSILGPLSSSWDYNELNFSTGQGTFKNVRASQVAIGDSIGVVSTIGVPLIINTALGVNSGTITITDGVNANIAITPNGTGRTNITNGTFINPLRLASYTAAALTALTGAVGDTAAVTNSPTVGGRLAFWDTTNARWSYVSDNTAV